MKAIEKIYVGILFATIAQASSAYADIWTCSAVCAEIYDFKVVDVRGSATNIGTGKTPGEAIESLAEVCTKFGRGYFPIVSNSTSNSNDTVVYATVANACIKN